MATTLKTSKNYGFDILESLGVDQALIKGAKNHGIIIENNLSGKLIVKYNGTAFGDVLVKANVLSLLKTNTLGPSSKQALGNQFETILQKAILHAKSMPSGGTFAVDYAEGESQDVMTTVNEEGQLHVVPSFNKLKPATKTFSNKVKLYHASALKQPVIGTSQNSTYIVFARFKGMNLAVKVDGDDFSIRAEGPSIGSYANALKAFGMSIKNGDYASGHYNADDHELMVKALGAVASQIGFSNLIEIADIMEVIGVAAA